MIMSPQFSLENNKKSKKTIFDDWKLSDLERLDLVTVNEYEGGPDAFKVEAYKRSKEILKLKQQALEQNIAEEAPGYFKARFDSKKNKFIIFDPDGNKTNDKITLEEIIIEKSLGKNFFFEKTPPDVLQKCSDAFTEYEQGWISDYNQSIDYIETHHETGNQLNTFLYEKFLIRSPELQGSEPAGFLLERMVQNMLIRHLAKNPRLGIRIESATVTEDIESKIDFKIHLTEDFYDGISMEYQDTRGLDVQLTQNVSKYEHKIAQTGRSRELGKTISGIYVLALKLENKEIMQAYYQWDESGRPIGGPEQFLGDDIKKKITDLLVGHIEDRLKELKDSPTAGSIIE